MYPVPGAGLPGIQEAELGNRLPVRAFSKNSFAKRPSPEVGEFIHYDRTESWLSPEPGVFTFS